MSLREHVLTTLSAELPRESVHVPEWGETVLVRVMTGAERDAFEMHVFNARRRGLEQTRAAMVAFSVCDADGVLVFKPEDIPRLAAGSSLPLTRIADVVQRLSGLDEKAVEDAAKN